MLAAGFVLFRFLGLGDDRLIDCVQVNRVYVLFDEPVQLSAVRIWNYTKTASRGVRDIAVCARLRLSLVDLLCCHMIH